MNIPDGMMEQLQKLVGHRDMKPCVSRAPGRIEVLGSHTDYNSGFVLAATIDKYVWSLGVPSDTVRLYSMDFSEYAEFSPTRFGTSMDLSWMKYARGIFWAFQRRKQNVRGVTAVIHGDVPRGGGLSSSAAFEVSFTNLVIRTSNIRLNAKATAMISFEAENLYCGVSCGVMDQFTSQLGQPDSLLSINCRNLMTNNIPFKTDASFVVIDSMVSRVANSALGGRREECVAALKELQKAEWSIQTLSDIQPEYLPKVANVLNERLTNRVTHVVMENQRVRKGIEFLKENDVSKFGSLMGESHNSSRDLYEVSHPNLNSLVEISNRQSGVFGARLTGAGLGGSVLALVSNKDIADFSKVVAREYEEETGIEPDITPVRIPGGVSVEQV